MGSPFNICTTEVSKELYLCENITCKIKKEKKAIILFKHPVPWEV